MTVVLIEMRSLWLLFWTVFPTILSAQLFDNTWLMGYQGFIPPQLGDNYGIAVLKFSNGTAEVEENAVSIMNFQDNNSAFSDSSGNLIAYFNGLQIENADFQLLDFGHDMDMEISIYQYWSDVDPPQGSMFLPWPEHPDSVLLIYSGDFFIPGSGTANRNLSYAVIDRKANGGLGKVVAREQPIIEDTIAYGQVTACKHANGRDWWIVTPEHDANRFYRILIDPDGIHVVGQQTVADTIFQGLGQSCFSPDGQYFASYNAISSSVGAWLDIFDFDRCIGTLSIQRHIYYAPGTGRIGGVAFSPNSRYLYHNFYDTVYPYDIQSAFLLASRKIVAIRDNYPFPKRFYLSQLAPDGKIYTSATNGMKALHVIHRPDEEGLACQYQQRGFALPVINAQSVPNFPNYRLGPLDGSSCDTLGLDNLLVAWWRYEQDTLNPNLFEFRDLSYYEPEQWIWDFGDGLGSSDRNPVHEYAQNGSYQVCLTVSNINGSNTFCRTIQLTTPAAQPPQNKLIYVRPTLITAQLLVSCENCPDNSIFRLYDMTGRLLQENKLPPGLNTIDTSALNPGFYFWEVVAGDKRFEQGKVFKSIK
ncbi:MAG: PKD domain-containing protein [Saprospiraceae bacterium]|nr:PKD domain-containing protein [Saprospiraceae bacterium]